MERKKKKTHILMQNYLLDYLSIFFICLLQIFRKPGEQKHSKEPSSLQCMHLAVVACGDRLEETLIMLKSAVLFSNRRLCFHIFSEDSLKPEFEKKVSFFVFFFHLVNKYTSHLHATNPGAKLH